MLLIVQIESKKGIEKLDDILSVEGVDGAVIGRGDISADLGMPGNTQHPDVLKQVEIMIAACAEERNSRSAGPGYSICKGMDPQRGPPGSVCQ
jgi:2-keto-3-deoxy-L-rhamnonate aldolase RhmA